MRFGVLAIVALVAGCASQTRHTPLFFAAEPPPDIVGKTSEAELLARRGPPLSQMTASDGNHVDVYYVLVSRRSSFRSLTSPPSANPGDLLPADGSNGLPDIKIEYVFSSDGILREMRTAMGVKTSKP